MAKDLILVPVTQLTQIPRKWIQDQRQEGKKINEVTRLDSGPALALAVVPNGQCMTIDDSADEAGSEMEVKTRKMEFSPPNASSARVKDPQWLWDFCPTV